ncbi:hypothetical protein [Jiangella endophytica]|uniref:hypothetical protein n=1 Tax=Jiangella endophytica TaxID=1623398 RepID=UPI000E3533A2|nr:hypothetical protein [Jiangella endophytica]
MSDSTTDTPDRLRRWRTPIVSAAIAGGLLLGGYGIAAAADSGSSTPDTSESEPAAPDTESGRPDAPESTAPDQARPGQPSDGEGRGGPGGAGCDEAPDDGQAPEDGQAPDQAPEGEQGRTESSATT